MVVVIDLGFESNLRPALLQVVPRIEFVDDHYRWPLADLSAYFLLDLLFPVFCRLREMFHYSGGSLLS